MTARKLTLFAAIGMMFLVSKSAVLAATAINTITLDVPGPVVNNTANITSVMLGSTLITSADFVYAASVTQPTAGTGGLFWGVGEGTATPADLSLANNLSGANVVRGTTNPTQAIDVFFTAALDPSSTTVTPYIFIFEPNATGTESWTAQAIVGGTSAAPVFGGTAFNFNTTGFGDTGYDVNFRRSAAESLTQDLIGIGISLTDLGISSGTSVLGVRITSSQGDPAAIFAGFAPIPELSRALLFIGALLAMSLKRKRTRQ